MRSGAILARIGAVLVGLGAVAQAVPDSTSNACCCCDVRHQVISCTLAIPKSECFCVAAICPADAPTVFVDAPTPTDHTSPPTHSPDYTTAPANSPQWSSRLPTVVTPPPPPPPAPTPAGPGYPAGPAGPAGMGGSRRAPMPVRLPRAVPPRKRPSPAAPLDLNVDWETVQDFEWCCCCGGASGNEAVCEPSKPGDCHCEVRCEPMRP